MPTAATRPVSGTEGRRASAVPARVAGSSKPQASKNFSSCLRAASSFQARSRRIASISASAAFLAVVRGVQRDGEVDARGVVVRVGGEPRLELAELLARRAALDRRAASARADRGDLGMLLDLVGHAVEHLAAPGPPRRAPSGRGRGRRRPRRSRAPAGPARRRARSAAWWSPASAAALASASRSAPGIWPPAAFSRPSMKRFTSPSGSAPWKRSAIWPCQKATTVGTDCSGRPICASCWTSARFLSMSILTSRTRPPAARTTFSSVGVSVLQGPHQVAQKSTRTGTSRRGLDDVLHEGLLVAVLDDVARRRRRRRPRARAGGSGRRSRPWQAFPRSVGDRCAQSGM